MKSHINKLLIKAITNIAACLAGLMMHVASVANDGKKPSSVAVKGSVPVNYYQAFMICVAVSYGIYLIVRARRRKRNSRISK